MTVITASGRENLPDHFTAAVAIAGAGPVGLSLALDLGLQGVQVIVLDGELRQASSDRVRRANAINNRALEFMRRLGVSAAIADAAAADPRRGNLDVAFATSLVGCELARFVNAFESSPDLPPEDLSPESYLRVNQIEIEAVLRDRIAALDNVICIEGCRFDTFGEDEAGLDIRAVLLPDDAPLTIRAEYLAGCDGGASTVRKAAGFRLAGEGSLAKNLNITFRGPAVSAANVHADASMYWIVNDHFDGYIGAGPEGGRLTLFDVDDAYFARVEADPLAVIRAAVGKAVDVEPVSLDRWQTHHLIAGEYRRGRVFLAGDAAHMHPPTGGLGMNTGLGDISNLGWKLGAVLKGWGGPALLDSYHAERHPIGSQIVSQSNHQYNRPASWFRRPHLDAQGPQGEAARAAARASILREKETEFFSRGLVLGQTYLPSPVVAGEPGGRLNTGVVTYRPTAQPGARLPHQRIAGRSVYDLLARDGFTLLAAEGAATGAMAAIAQERGFPLSILVLPAGAMALYERPYVLVRPDHHVAWRGDAPFTAELAGMVTGRAEALAAAGL